MNYRYVELIMGGSLFIFYKQQRKTVSGYKDTRMLTGIGARQMNTNYYVKDTMYAGFDVVAIVVQVNISGISRQKLVRLKKM